MSIVRVAEKPTWFRKGLGKNHVRLIPGKRLSTQNISKSKDVLPELHFHGGHGSRGDSDPVYNPRGHELNNILLFCA